MHSFMTCQWSTVAWGAHWRPPDSSSNAARPLTSHRASTINVAVNENPAERCPSLLCCMQLSAQSPSLRIAARRVQRLKPQGRRFDPVPAHSTAGQIPT
jgi:hypothetical protein